MNKLLSCLVCALLTANAFAQDPKGSAIDINSSYRPVLRNAVKINLAGSQLPADTGRAVDPYVIPRQNLFYAYSPVALRPLALAQDTNLYLGNRKFLKIGYGNFSTPYLNGGLSFGDGKKGLLNLTADFIQSKGNTENQDYTHVNAKAGGSYFFPKNEFYGSAEANLRSYYLYGYDHAVFKPAKDSIRQEFQNFTLRGGFKNTSQNGSGINYDPNFSLSFFSNKDKATETDAVISLPAEKILNENFSVRAEVKADITQYSVKNSGTGNSISNTIVQIAPSVNFHNDIIKLHAGATPAWNNKTYELLPEIYAEAKVKDKPFSVQAGWVGRLVKNSYRNLTILNPYLVPVNFQLNTKETEYYGGIKAGFAKHFNVSAKAGLIRYKNLPLFINDTADEKSFLIVNEEKISNFRVHADLSYINRDKFTLTASLTLNGYNSLKTNARAWHTIPAEVRGSLRWWAFKTVLVKSDLWFFDGSNYLAKGNNSKPLSGGTDLSAGVEIKINRNFSVWADANNILNSKYGRWHNYEVYGANFIGGLLLNF